MTQTLPPIAYLSSASVHGFQPRYGRLITAGILLVLAAAAFGCCATLPLIMGARGNTLGASWQHRLVNAAGYLALTFVCGVLGIGALLGRRWSRPLTLILATHWLIVGVFVTLGLALFLPMMSQAITTGSAAVPGTVVAIFLAIAIAVVLVMMVVWPGLLLLMMRPDDVRRTCELRDPVRRWTDDRPLKIIGLELTLVLAALLFLLSGLQPVLPFFGLMLHGPSKLALAAAASIGSIIAAVEVHRLRPAGWWLGLLTTTIPLLAYVPSALTMPIREYYIALGTPVRTADMFVGNSALTRFSLVAFPLVFAIGFAIYMLRLRNTYVAAGAVARGPSTLADHIANATIVSPAE